VLLRILTLFAGLSSPLAAVVIGYDTPGSGTFGDPNSSTYAVVYNTPADVGGINLNGVVEISSGVGTCSGVLLDDNQSILTAAHCIDPNYVPNFSTFLPSSVSVYFSYPNCAAIPGAVYPYCGMPQGILVSSVSDFFIDPGWHADGGQIAEGNDLAVLRLPSAAPAFASGYQLFNGGAIDPNNPIDVVGAGIGGKGAIDPTNYPAGAVMRQGESNYLATCNLIFPGQCSSDVLLAAFYASATVSNQVEIAGGDSGGPSFYNGQLVGIHEFGDCDPSDCEINSATTSLWGDTYVGGANALWIESTETPEPAPAVVLAIGLAGILLAGRRRVDSV